jgi:hypothetical protein
MCSTLNNLELVLCLPAFLFFEMGFLVIMLLSKVAFLDLSKEGPVYCTTVGYCMLLTVGCIISRVESKINVVVPNIFCFHFM